MFSMTRKNISQTGMVLLAGLLAAHNYTDWWLEEHLWYDDHDKPHGWVAAIRSMFNAVEPSKLRPAEPDEYGYSDDWWYETDTGSVECWVVRL